jgi:hypothetical protein
MKDCGTRLPARRTSTEKGFTGRRISPGSASSRS